MKLMDKLQILRKRDGMSQEKLAEILEISRQSVSKWESGISNPDMDNLLKLSEIFGITLDQLMRDRYWDNLNELPTNSKTDDKIEFLLKAKKETYAKGNGKTHSSRPNSYDYRYEEGNLIYIDTYLGSEKFVGEEALWVDEIPIWSMNYSGRVIAEEFSSSFLKEVLQNVNKDYPYRGPLTYKKGDYSYHLIINGDFKWFNGYEEIFYKDKKVYECFIHGGEVK